MEKKPPYTSIVYLLTQQEVAQARLQVVLKESVALQCFEILFF